MGDQVGIAYYPELRPHGHSSIIDGGLLPDKKDISYFKRIGTISPECWYGSLGDGAPSGTYAMSANTFFAVPFIVPKKITLDSIAIKVTTLGAGLVRLGIYSDNNIYPYTKILDAGTVDVSTTGVKTITITQSLSEGLYWLVALSNIAVTLSSYLWGNILSIFGSSSAFADNGKMYSVTQAYGTLPATYPSGGALVTTSVLGIIVRLSA